METEMSANSAAESQVQDLNGSPEGDSNQNGRQTPRRDATPSDGRAPVIIVGAGPVGLLLALRLAQKQIHSIVLEKDSAPSPLPRAIGYYGPVHDVFQEMGLYDRIADEGMPSGGYVWRKAPTDVLDQNGSVVAKELGQILGQNMMSYPGPDGKYKLGHYSIQLPQCRLAEIFLQEAAKTGHVSVFWDHKVAAIAQDENEVSVTVATNGGLATFTGQYLAACDGGKSMIRKLLGIRLSGHSWPERFLATDVLRTAPVLAEVPVHFTVDEKFWGVCTPLERVEAGKRGLWRYSLAVPAKPNDDPDCVPLTDEQVLEQEYVDSLLLRHIDGPRPSDHIVVRKSLYKMHQLLASTMYRGRCFLAGDAAHINNPIGGLGLCTGLLDADALSQTLEIALTSPGDQKASDDALRRLFVRYSTERRWVFQNIIHPFSSANKTRLHGGNPDDVAREDWYFVALSQGNKLELEAIHRPLYASWRTNMWQFWDKSGTTGA
ncbi:FAD binding domain-containingprotein [Purpureocillium lavendulum]|uniref:FAD binding domain-containingprotein n=1 Tax=Purpureocillium lavendulum TaxID=1247861 RepID=A0AB34FWC5_9HYPO|nr:FAD binding domain-containingprotein [Purpureocillium lavendulum]